MIVRLRLALGVCLCAIALVAARPSAAPVPATISVIGIGGLAMGTTGPAFTVTLSQPVASDLTLQIALTGEGSPGSSLSPSTLSFGPGESIKTFALTAGFNLGQLQISYVVTGTDAASYTAPAPHFVQIKAPMTLSLQSVIPAGGSVQGTASAGQVPIQGDLILTISLDGPGAAGASVSPAVTTLSGFNASAPFTITTGPSSGAIIVNFAVSGEAAAKHAAPGSRTLQPLTPITVTGPAVVPRSSTSSPFTVTLSTPPPAPLTINLNPTGVAGATLSTNTLTFAPGETTKTFTITTPALGGPLGVVFSLSGDGAPFYQAPAPFASWVETRIRTNISSAPLNRGTSRAFNISLDRVAVAPITVTLSLSGAGAAGASLSQTVFEFAPGTAFKPVTLQAGLNLGDLVISGVSSGPDAIYSSAPESATIRIVAPMAIQGPIGPVANEAPSAFSLVLPIPAPGPFTATLSASGAVAAGVTFTPSTVSFAAGETSKPFTVGGTTIGTATINVALSGPGAEYLAAGSRTITVGGRVAVSSPASMPASSSATVTLTLPIPAPTAFVVNMAPAGPAAAGASVTPASVSFAAGETSKTFTVNSGPTTGTLGINTILVPNTGLFRLNGFSIQVSSGAPTPTGTNITVTPPALTGGAGIDVTFAQVTGAGTTQFTTVAPAAQFAPPSGFELPGMALYFGVSTSAQIIGPVTVCGGYPQGAATDETALRIFVRINGAWVDVTSTIDTSGNRICGEIASLDPAGALMAIFRPNTAPTVGTISGPSLVSAGENAAFSATISDANASDTLTATWIWDDGSTSPATIVTADGITTATGEHTFSTGGTFAVALVVTDGATPVRSADHALTVDAAAPVIASLTASPEFIWPPDKKMHHVVLTVEATDDGSTPVCAISNVEAEGLAAGDYAITGPLALQISAGPNRRVYTITVTCTDAVGRAATKSATVDVDKEKKKDK